MEKQVAVTCPKCGREIVDDPLIHAAISGEGQTSQFINCECGHKLTFWAITAQLREQVTFGQKVKNWFKGRSKK